MSEFPKALYCGDVQHHTMAIANDTNDEQQLRDDGFTDFYALPEHVEAVAGGDLSGSTTDDEKVAWLEDQLATSQGEFIAFQNDIAAMKARIAELQGDTTPVGATSESVNYADWTADQLREELKNQGKEFKARDSKAELIAILEA